MANHQTTKSCYTTKKLVFAAYLMAAGKARLLGTSPVAGSNKAAFVLSREPAPEDIAGFFDGSATVSALRYSEAINSLKGIAYEARTSSAGC